jgi:hypothetical protein
MPDSDQLSLELHRRLAHWNRRRLSPTRPTQNWREALREDAQLALIEGEWIEAERTAVAHLARSAPRQADRFVAWFESLESSGPGQGDALFPWLAEEADLVGFSWFLEQEAAGEAGFDDLVALAQVKMPERPKLELARNYWDEMGRGNPKGMHGKMLADLVQALALEPTIEETVWPSLALANAMTAFSTNRRYAFHAIGALGAIELTAPGRARMVANGLRRLGVRGDHRHYFDLHAVLDLRHSEAWNREVLHPLVGEDPSRAQFIAEGALIRLRRGAKCFEAYRAHLWTDLVH